MFFVSLATKSRVMDNKTKHLLYLKSKPNFHIDCSLGIFCDSEILMLREWGNWYQGLSEGKLSPFTEAQGHFVKAVQNLELLSTRDEWMWFKYLTRKKMEAELAKLSPRQLKTLLQPLPPPPLSPLPLPPFPLRPTEKGLNP